ncbi:MotA/TolQ/ExbB proton channel family protein [Polynucleobacter paneuropaeus]|nr:MotA/TolQ/ExbB proton channel family protein [Polynucleobacter paneuropaeus]MBT8600863.1 MotA/TolQ/ExbB proton channel family protein [Polynucleobacter paneuropaeus]MBT8608693.1 MotA/TolQ/ExbB proton channel family protein [Polynucleobacter paneuropaeus]
MMNVNANVNVISIVLGLLVLLSIFTWVLALYKFLQSRKASQNDRAFSKSFWNCTSWEAARSAVVDNKTDLGQIANAGFIVYDEYLSNPHSLRHAGEVNEVLERPLQQKAEEILRQREKGLNELASIGSLSPFIGLFGTVWGIMDALKAIGESGQASIDMVAGPIGEALISTAIGIAVALPAVFFYNYFVRQLTLVSTNLDGFINDFLRLAVAQVKKIHH